MSEPQKNSFDLLRLVAAALVLYSHQHALLGLAEPMLFNWTTLGSFGVAIFFFLSGFLVWSSWARDSDLTRFFIRRSLRIFPALWLAVLLTVLVVGVVSSQLSTSDYFASSETWRYLSTGLLVVRQGLPGVFTGNPYPLAVNGSLWTLPVEFLCYVSVALVGSISFMPRNWLLTLSLGLSIFAASLSAHFLGARFIPHLEMVAIFWWGVMYGFVLRQPVVEFTRWLVVAGVFFTFFLLLGSRGVERSGTLVLAVLLVVCAQRVPWGAAVTDRLGDLSYGLYIFAFPVQQIVAEFGGRRDWSFSAHLGVSFVVTSLLAYMSWHLLEKWALLFKPKRKAYQ